MTIKPITQMIATRFLVSLGIKLLATAADRILAEYRGVLSSSPSSQRVYLA